MRTVSDLQLLAAGFFPGVAVGVLATWLGIAWFINYRRPR